MKSKEKETRTTTTAQQQQAGITVIHMKKTMVSRVFGGRTRKVGKSAVFLQ
jgi:hypothetical protein